MSRMAFHFFLLLLKLSDATPRAQQDEVMTRLAAYEEEVKSLREEVQSLREEARLGRSNHRDERNLLSSTNRTRACQPTRIDSSSINTCSLNVTGDIYFRGQRLAAFVEHAMTEAVSDM